MQLYFELVDWQAIKLPSAERRQRHSLKSFERSAEVWKDWIRLKKELATLGEELSPVEMLPAKRKKQSPDPKKKRRRQRGVWTKSTSRGQHVGFVVMSTDTFGKFWQKKTDIGIICDSVARQMLQKTVQHYWVNIVKQHVTGWGCPTLRDTLS